jgi:biopolymer transport protein ExbD
MSFTTPSRQRAGPVLPLASMVDMLFLLLIFFMTASTFREQELQIDVALPAAETAEPGRAATQIIITITDDGRIHLGDRHFTLPELRQTLTRLAQTYPDEAVVIRGDQDSRLGIVTDVIDTAYAVGLRNVSIGAQRRGDP